ncbi:outer membrane beta-barrel protein [Chitinophaga sp. GCM10012297]|uniref:PorT family protein n=1 Tax=Chitinophaga chungangae TaxID=2821488 RepID=A0ABS3YED2_9BACT|nr:outer membrane beta-barrel protein [Chitinophaga chungangae]MBO9153051.1 PorT family protein [Chitinophaga chungangae]
MKKLLFTLGLIAVSAGVFAQDNNGAGAAAIGKAREKVSFSRDFLVIGISYDGWASAPDSVKTKGLSRGFNIALMYDFPVTKEHFSVALGLGFSSSSVFLDDQYIDMTNGQSSAVRFVNDADKYKKYKVATNYLEVPLEFRFRAVSDNANKGFKASIGAKVGMLVNAHTKGKNSLGGEKNIIKEQNKRFFNPWRFAGTARVGYGNFAVFGTVNLNPLFKDNTNLDIRPYSIGIALSGL